MNHPYLDRLKCFHTNTKTYFHFSWTTPTLSLSLSLSLSRPHFCCSSFSYSHSHSYFATSNSVLAHGPPQNVTQANDSPLSKELHADTISLYQHTIILL